MMTFTYALQGDSRIPLYHQLKDLIMREIQEGGWKSDEMIPTELEISEQFSLSRTTVRQAITDLVKENILYRKRGVGTFIAKPKIDLYYMKKSVSFNEQVRQAGLLPATKVIECAVIPASAEIAAEMNLEINEKIICLKRVRYAGNEPIVWVVSYLPQVLCHFIMDLDLEKVSLFQSLAQYEQTRVVKIKRLVEAQQANAEDRKLMCQEKDFPVQYFISHAYNKEGVVLEYSFARYRGDRNKFYVEIDVTQDD
jgi:GntR family transcriptional regulator